eukprot:TRINITY_DN18374_c1_g1_i1.p1 TRINITY_DN18374_c1_g1~~TRINITY_DN18374_c1_g1_i1.p1  ORF type:complete len:362 (+),score=32.83 TRINITY_DN18374_c1_g1_i1:76-1161(+)
MRNCREIFRFGRLLSRCKEYVKTQSAYFSSRSQNQPVAWTDNRGYQHFGKRGPWYYNRRIWYGIGGFVFIGGSVYISSLQSVPYTGRSHSVLVSVANEQAMGHQLFRQTKQQAAMTRTLLPDTHPYTRKVNHIGMKIVDQLPKLPDGFSDHLKNLEWEFAVINNPQVNAFVLPGGKVVVFTGLLRLVIPEDELAGVLSHEIGHVVARHHGERMTSVFLFSIFQIVVGLLFGIMVPSGIFNLVMFLPHSRRNETEADKIGVRLMALACYDPTSMIPMLAKLGRAEEMMTGPGGKQHTLLRTHPVTDDRIKVVKSEIPSAQEIYNSGDCELKKRGLLDSMLDSYYHTRFLPTPDGWVRVVQID